MIKRKRGRGNLLKLLKVKSEQLDVEKETCDYEGVCKKVGYAEVYPALKKGDQGWNLLCREHFTEERERLGNELPYCLVDDSLNKR